MWITTDYKGDKQVWYSADVIEKIVDMCHDINGLGAKTLAEEILKIIESEDK